MTRTVLLPHFIEGNQYIRDIGRAYKAAGCNVVYGSDNLFENSQKTDIIHIHWPESLYRWLTNESPEKKALQTIEALKLKKSLGAQIVWTVLNLNPHEAAASDLDLDKKTYQAIAELSDLIVHHCPFSTEETHRLYPASKTKKNIVTSRGHFQSVENRISPVDARRRLNLPLTAYVFLQFGYIRKYKGIFFLLKSFWKTNVPNKMLVIAGQYKTASERSSWLDLLVIRSLCLLDRRIRFFPHWIAEDEMQIFLNASDCIVLSHSSGLNSGLATLGMTFGKLVIGPNLGCIPYVLNSGKNLVYELNNVAELTKAMQSAGQQSKQEVYIANSAASAQWDWNKSIQLILSNLNSI